MLCWVCIPQAEEEHLSCATAFFTGKLVQIICSLLMKFVMLEQLHELLYWCP